MLFPAGPTQVLSSHGVRELEERQTGHSLKDAEDKTQTDPLEPLKQSYPSL